MPKLKRSVKGAPDRTGFESYDGPEPKPGVYRGKIKTCALRESSNGSGNLYYNVLIELEARKGDKENVRYDGYPAWVRLVMTEKEGNLAREKQFYRALNLKTEEPDVLHDEIDDGGKVKKIGGKDPIGAIVKVDIKTDRYEGEQRLSPDAIYPVDPAKESDADADEEEPEEDDDDIDEDEDFDDDDVEDEEDEAEEEVPDYASMKLPELKRLAKDAGIDSKGKSAKALAAALTEAWEAEEDEADDDDEPEEDEEEGTTVAEAREWKLTQLKKFAREEGGYPAADLNGLKAPEIIEMLVDDEVLIMGDDEPPF